MSRIVKKYEIQTALFSKQRGLPSWKQASRYISKCLLPDEYKTVKLRQVIRYANETCGHTSNNSIKFPKSKIAFTTETKPA